MQPGDGVAWIGAFADAVRSGGSSPGGGRAPRCPMGLVVAPGMSGAGEALDAAASALDRPVVRVLAIPAEAAVPLGALRSVVADLPADDVVAARQRLAADHGGAVLVVDEAHWLDDRSLAVLAGLAARPETHDLGLLVAHRPADSSSLAALDEAMAAAGPVVHADGLDVDDVASRLAATTGRAASSEAAAWLHHVTGGRLGLVDLLLESWDELAPEVGVPEPGSALRVPGPAVAALRLRLGPLSVPARDLLALGAVAPAASADLAAAALDLDSSQVAAALGELRAAGVLVPAVSGDGDPTAGPPAVIPVLRAVAARLTPAEERAELERRVGRALAGEHGSVVQAAHHLAAAGATGPAAADVFGRAADEVGVSDPALALDWYGRARAAGGRSEVSVARAELQAWVGDLDGALAGALAALDDPDPGVRARAAATAAVASYRRGRARQALELAGASPGPADLGVPIAAARGDAVPTGQDGALFASPDASDAAARLRRALAAAVAEAVGADPVAAVASFLEAQALLETVPRVVLVVESPAVLGAATALVCGDVAAARELLRRAASGRLPGLFARSVEAWSAWAATVTAGAPSAGADRGDGGPAAVAARDQLVVAAVEAGRARRAGDVRALQDAWTAAEPILLAVEPDLWLLEPALELAASAVRLDPQRRADVWTGALEAAASQAGAAAPWLVALGWGRLQVALAADDPEAVAAEAAALARLDGPTLPPGAAALVAAAAAWGDVVGGRVDAAAVEEAAGGLAAVERRWDASRLVGQAAVRATDPAVARRLLVRARELGGAVGGTPEASASTVLSDREAEIGRLVLEGRTHKEIGAQLFLSPKTIEHHVARIRTKLGAGSRAEMVAALRRELEGAPAPG